MNITRRGAQGPATPVKRQGEAAGKEQILQRLQAKQQIVEQLADGRLALLPAAERFRQLCPGTQEDEALCRNLIGWVQLALADRPERAETMTCKLEQELEALVARHAPA